jgi:hypothetical protein
LVSTPIPITKTYICESRNPLCDFGQRRGFFDSINNRYWIFYRTPGTGVRARSSITPCDSDSWDEIIICNTLSYGVDVAVSGNRVHVVRTYGYTAYYRSGLCTSSGTIDWTADEVGVHTTPSIPIQEVSICCDSNGYPAVSCREYHSVRVARSSTNDGTWTEQFDVPLLASEYGPRLIALSNDDLLVSVTDYSTGELSCMRWDHTNPIPESGWLNEVTLSQSVGDSFSVTTYSGANAFIGFKSNGNAKSAVYRSSDDSFQDLTTHSDLNTANLHHIGTSSDYIGASGVYLVAFNNYISVGYYYKYFNGISWGSPVAMGEGNDSDEISVGRTLENGLLTVYYVTPVTVTSGNLYFKCYPPIATEDEVHNYAFIFTDASSSYDPDTPFSDLSFTWSGAGYQPAYGITNCYVKDDATDDTTLTVKLKVTDNSPIPLSNTVTKTLTMLEENVIALCVASDDIVYTTISGGGSIDEWNKYTISGVTSVAASNKGLTMLAGNDSGELWKTTDSISWSKIHTFTTGISDIYIDKVKNPQDYPNTAICWVGLSNGNLYKSIDSFNNWSLITTLPHDIVEIKGSNIISNKLVVAAGNDLYLTNTGLGWFNKSFAHDINGIDFKGDIIGVILSNGDVSYSLDFGKIWTSATGEPTTGTDFGFGSSIYNSFIVASGSLYICTTTSGTISFGSAITISGINKCIEVSPNMYFALVGTSEHLYKTVDWGHNVYNLLSIPVNDIAIGCMIPTSGW